MLLLMDSDVAAIFSRSPLRRHRDYLVQNQPAVPADNFLFRQSGSLSGKVIKLYTSGNDDAIFALLSGYVDLIVTFSQSVYVYLYPVCLVEFSRFFKYLEPLSGSQIFAFSNPEMTAATETAM